MDPDARIDARIDDLHLDLLACLSRVYGAAAAPGRLRRPEPHFPNAPFLGAGACHDLRDSLA